MPCIVEDVKLGDPRFTELLIAYNKQRIKKNDTLLKEAIAGIDPAQAFEALVNHRKISGHVNTVGMHRIPGTTGGWLSSVVAALLQA